MKDQECPGSARGEAEEKCDAEREEQPEDEDAPIRWQDEVRRVVGRVDAAHDKRRGPPGKDCPERGGEEREHGIFNEDEA